MMAPEVLVLKTELAMVEARCARLEREIAEIKALQAQSAAQIGPAQEFEVVLVRILGAAEPFAELVLWMGERRAQNQSLGGDDDKFCAQAAFALLQFSLPVAAGDSK